ncbi:MAG: tail fiber protein [Nostoc sp. DedVER02]|uniref:tail fiber protein n=1 Tax=unclassified Nostoc TaxID=2593658 RepID=UPI002AD5599F|nr:MULTISPECIES: tail fiber protein [unclassified Nostoc]MDZ7987134.1 tail fiber protein [Nostoc sp. DedVER02]MDZ8110996.1 tail fiber protein [Nostoc sp. DedVER01b]
MRPILQNGQVFTAEIANAIANPIVDGADFLGHGPKVLDEYLDDTPGQIKSNFYSFYNRLKVSYQSGLTFNYLGGVLLLSTGALVSISPGSINIPNNVTRFIFVGSDGTVQAASSLPNESFPMAKVTTASGVLSGNVIDLRNKVIDRVTPSTIPVTQLIPPGASMEFSGSILPSGWLWEDGSFYAPSTYPELFAAIGYTYGQSGTNFRVPDSRGRVAVGAGTGTGLTNRVLGQTGGLEGVTLNLAQTPSHTHGINDPGHNHSVNESAHSHGLSDPGHAHGVYDPGHAHSIYANTTDGNSGQRDQTDGFLAKVNVAITGEDVGGQGYIATNLNGVQLVTNSASNIGIYAAGTGIGIGSNKTNVSLNPAASGITINAQGGNGSHENMQPWLAKNKIIKY